VRVLLFFMLMVALYGDSDETLVSSISCNYETDVLRAGMRVTTEVPIPMELSPVIEAPEPSPTPEMVSLGMFLTSGYTDRDAGMDGRGITRSGERTHPGVVAVDTDIIPLQTVLQIEGMGSFTALDTGGGIYGNRLDIWFPDRDAALQHGVQLLEVSTTVAERR
jgi:3D (Asp-Asp-Asp) domain-containing protein